MSENNKLSEVSRAIAMPGCKFTPTALVFTKVTKPILARAGQYLQTVEACRSWWWGDFMNAYCGMKLAEEKARMPVRVSTQPTQETEARRYVHFTGEYSEATGRANDTLHEWRAVASFYEVGRRRPTCSWTHHAEAMDGANGKIEIAIAWLKRAEVDGLSVTELRAAIRTEARLPLNTEPAAPFTYAEVVAFKRWASAARKRLASMDAREAATLRQDLQPAVDLAAAIDARQGATLTLQQLPSKKFTGPSRRPPTEVE